ncbi:MAG: 4Fe-4S dicluster domain-containing protein [Christensenellales bacterium]|jgi:formate dehydrogenase subunit beta
MQAIEKAIKDKARALLLDGTVNRVLGWKKGDYFYDNTPSILGVDDIGDLVYNCFCGANLSKYLINESRREGKVLVLLKPCDTYSFNLLLKEHRIRRDGIYVLGIPCHGIADVQKMNMRGIKGIEAIEENDGLLTVSTLYGEKSCKLSDVLLERCSACKGKEHMVADEVIEDTNPVDIKPYDRFAMVNRLDNMSSEDRFAFWRSELSKCIRCHACRNACPACSCLKCVFDNDASGISSKANVDTSDENMFHIIRAFHVAGRCTDCGECSRVCPQGIPLHLLNRKIINDINMLYGEYQSGADINEPWPLGDYRDDDVEPGAAAEGGKR